MGWAGFLGMKKGEIAENVIIDRRNRKRNRRRRRRKETGNEKQKNIDTIVLRKNIGIFSEMDNDE